MDTLREQCVDDALILSTHCAAHRFRLTRMTLAQLLPGLLLCNRDVPGSRSVSPVEVVEVVRSAWGRPL